VNAECSIWYSSAITYANKVTDQW